MRVASLVFLSAILVCCLFFAGCFDSPTESTPPALAITSPVSGSKVLAGDSITISWNKELTDYTIEFFDPFIQQYREESIAEPLPHVMLSSNTIRARVEYEMLAESLLVRLIDNTTMDTAETVYLLRHILITQAPVTGSQLKVGDTVQITWRLSNEVSSIVLGLTWDQGKFSGIIHGDGAIEYPDTTYTWIIGAGNEQDITYPLTDASIHVEGYVESDWKDDSDALFTVTY